MKTTSLFIVWHISDGRMDVCKTEYHCGCIDINLVPLSDITNFTKKDYDHFPVIKEALTIKCPKQIEEDEETPF